MKKSKWDIGKHMTMKKTCLAQKVFKKLAWFGTWNAVLTTAQPLDAFAEPPGETGAPRRTVQGSAADGPLPLASLPASKGMATKTRSVPLEKSIAAGSSGHQISWTRGWNLVAWPKSWGRVRFLDNTKVWRFGSLLEKASNKFSVFWLFAEEPGHIRVSASDPSEHPASLFSSTGWNVFSVPKPLPHADTQGGSVHRWDSASERYVAVPAGSMLQPGVGYVRFALVPHEPEKTDLLDAPSSNQLLDNKARTQGNLSAASLGRPALRILQPPTTPIRTRIDTLDFGGEAVGLEALSVNGIRLLENNESFLVTVDLVPGLNTVLFEAKTKNGRPIRVVRQVHFDPTPPVIALYAEPTEQASKDQVTVVGEVRGNHLADVWIGGHRVGPDVARAFQQTVRLDDLSVGEIRIFQVRARDHVGHETIQSLSFFRNKEGVSVRPLAKTVGVSMIWPEEVTTQFLDVAFTDGWGNEEIHRVNRPSSEPGSAATSWFYFDDLLEVDDARLIQIRVRNAHTSMPVALSMDLLQRREAPAASDTEAPRLVVHTPERDIVYVAQSDVRFEGSVEDPSFFRLSLNGVHIQTRPGPFSYAATLPSQGEHVFRLLAKDHSQNEVLRTFKVVLDQQAPKLRIFGGLRKTVYGPHVRLQGAVEEAHPGRLNLYSDKSTNGDPLPVLVRNGTFSIALTLNEGGNTFTIEAEDAAKNTTIQTIHRYYEPSGIQMARTPNPPANPVAFLRDQTVFLSWQSPKQWSDGTLIPPGVHLGYELFRDGVRVQHDLKDSSVEDRLPDGEEPLRYHVVTTVQDASGKVLRSKASQNVYLFHADAVRPPAAGEFEAPYAVSASGIRASQPEVLITEEANQVVTHLAYLVPGRGGRRDRIEYRRSLGFGAQGTWKKASVVAAAPDGKAKITDWALGAQGSKVDIAWVEVETHTPAQDDPVSRIVLKRSCNGGMDFNSCPDGTRIFRESAAYKRDLSLAYDRQGHHHMVWGEANKIYHLRDLRGDTDREGRLVNVFDKLRKKPTTELIKMQVQYGRVNGQCPCEDCWCEEAYPVAPGEADKSSRSQDRHVGWLDDTFTYTPSLHVNDSEIAIIARQTKRWEPLPVPNPLWDTMLEDPVYSDDIVFRKQPTKLVVGWRKAWKTAYEDGDEDLYDGLGIRFQYRYRGTWHHNDRIQVAVRPIDEDGWRAPSVAPKDDGQTEDGVLEEDERWQVFVVDDDFEATLEGPHSYPDAVTTPSGRMIAVYEKGPSISPSNTRGNPLVLQISDDSGKTWFGPQTPFAYGHRPSVEIVRGPEASSPDEIAVLYVTPVGTIRVARSQDLHNFSDVALNEAKGTVESDLALATVGPSEATGSFLAAHSFSVHQDLLLAAWVQKGASDDEADQIVVARSSYTNEATRLSLSPRLPTTRNQNATIHIQSVNKYGISVPRNIHPTEAATNQSRPELHPAHLDLLEGQALASVPVEWLDDVALEGNLKIEVNANATAYEDHAGGNLSRALALRNELQKAVPSEPRQRIQREYHPETTNLQIQHLVDGPLNLDTQDAEYLASFERVWVYTQGIALHQAVRRHENETSQELARWLCDPAQAVWQGDRILGWPFSKNTKGDTWKDARLVTGANAWAIHGLGAFLVSEAFTSLAQSEKTDFRACYLGALRGLETHVVAVGLEKRRKRSPTSDCRIEECAFLMTAGWSTEGLEKAQTPWALGLTDNSSEQWRYYDVLNAVGYERFDELLPPSVRRSFVAEDGLWVEDDLWVLTEADFQVLQVRTKAQNVVTEHNLDVLSVLNHALKHTDEIWSDTSEAGRKEVRNWLRPWRDGLRAGIFELLWHTPSSTTQDEEKEPHACRPETKRFEQRSHAITGGGFDEEGTFQPNPEVAVDNCSWLALSVNFDDLPSDRVDQLSECLVYTVDKFADVMPYGSNGQCYYGAHYFPNTFKDPYISQSDRQEISYHLEATAGLILGLYRFHQAHPNRGEDFHEKSHRLWSGVQTFVRDHGFVYSSQRIQDLSARLASSTAVIWYLDVYDALEHLDDGLDRPLHSYAHQVDGAWVTGAIAGAWDRLKALGFEPENHAAARDSSGEKDQDFGSLATETGRGLFLVSDPGSENPKARVEDQALGLLAAVNHQDFDSADRWASGLLDTVVQESNELLGEDWYFPIEVDAQTASMTINGRSLDIQLLSIYALTRYYSHHPARDATQGALNEPSFRSVRAAITEVMRTLDRRNHRRQGDLAWVAAPVEGGGPERAYSHHQVLAYFALLEADALGLLHSVKMNTRSFSAALRTRFWNDEGEHPWHSVPSGPGTESTTLGTAALYSLFAAHVGDTQKARLALDAGLLFQLSTGALKTTSESGSTKMGAAPLRAHGFLDAPLLWILALRRGRELDPRLGEIALVEFEDWLSRLDSEASSLGNPGAHAAQVLIQSPAGLFGAHSGPLVLGATLPGLNNGRNDEPVRLLFELDETYVETLGALLASDASPALFDTLVVELTILRFVEEMVEQEVPVSTWMERLAPGFKNPDSRRMGNRMRQTAAELRDLCSDEAPLTPKRALIERYLGMACPVVVSLFESLLVLRGGSVEADMGVLVHGFGAGGSRTPIARVLAGWATRLLGAPGQSNVNYEPGDALLGNNTREALTGPIRRTWDAAVFDQPLDIPGSEPPNLADAQAMLRGRLHQAVTDTIESSDGFTTTYAWEGLDSLASFHPESPLYWQRAAIELRLFHDEMNPQHSRQTLAYSFEGHASGAPEFTTTPEAVEAQRRFRRFVHRYAGGSLPSLAKRSGLPLLYLHRSLQTGEVHADTWSKLYAAYGLRATEDHGQGAEGSRPSMAWYGGDGTRPMSLAEEPDAIMLPLVGEFSAWLETLKSGSAQANGLWPLVISASADSEPRLGPRDFGCVPFWSPTGGGGAFNLGARICETTRRTRGAQASPYPNHGDCDHGGDKRRDERGRNRTPG